MTSTTSSISSLETYGQELVAAGFEVWLTRTGYRNGGYLQYRDPENGCTGSLQESFTEGWQHLMPLIPSREHGSAMHIGNPLPVWTVEAARQCAQPFNWNDVVGRQANAKDRQWRSASAIALHSPARIETTADQIIAGDFIVHPNGNVLVTSVERKASTTPGTESDAPMVVLTLADPTWQRAVFEPDERVSVVREPSKGWDDPSVSAIAGHLGFLRGGPDA